MFKFVNPASVWWPVTVEIPADGGAVTKGEFEAHFKLLPQTEIEALGKGTVAALLRSAMIDWRGLNDAADQALPCTAENIDTVCEWPCWRTGLVSAFYDAQSGHARKNA